MLEEEFPKRPSEIVLDTSPGNYDKFDNFPIDEFSRLKAIIKDKYRYETTVVGIRIYRLKSQFHSELTNHVQPPGDSETGSIVSSDP